MKFSIVTVALNSGKDLAPTVESVLMQDYADVEYIIIDGGSWDQSLAWYELYKDRVGNIVRVEDAGIFSAMRAALPHCSGDYVLFLNSGDKFYSKTVLSNVAEAGVGGADFLYGDHLYCYKGKEFLHRSALFRDIMTRIEDGSLDGRWHSRMPCHQATFTKMSVLRRLSYDNSYDLCADHELMLRAYSRGASFHYINEIICLYSGGGLSAQKHERLALELTFAYRKFSRFPSKIDTYFGIMPGHLPLQNAMIGFDIYGIGLPEGPFAEHGINMPIGWCGSDGVLIVSPDEPTVALTLVGYNIIDKQVVTIFCGDEIQGHSQVPVGMFELTLPFAEPILRKSVLLLEPGESSRLSDRDSRVACFALNRVEFRRASASLPRLGRGDQLFYRKGEKDCMSSLLSGWSHLEDDFVWSLSPSSLLILRVDKMIRSLTLRGHANPFIQAQQTLSIASGGMSKTQIEISSGVFSLEIALSPDRDDEIVVLMLEPGEFRAGGGDLRELGFALHCIVVPT